MSIPEQAGKVATGAIEALKGSPGLLAVILLQLVTLGVLFMAAQRNQDRAHAREMFLMEQCFPKQRVSTAFGDITSSVPPAHGPRTTGVPWWMPAKGTRP